MNITKLAEMFGVKTYEQENKQLHSDFDTLAKAYEQVKGANNVLAKQVIQLENEIDATAEIRKKATDIVHDYQEAIEKCEEMIDNMEQLIKQAESRGINIGRSDMCSKYGIWRLDANGRGNCLVRLNNDIMNPEIVELICDDLVDVKAVEGVGGEGPDDEIVIDDIAEADDEELSELAKIYYS